MIITVRLFIWNDAPLDFLHPGQIPLCPLRLPLPESQHSSINIDFLWIFNKFWKKKLLLESLSWLIGAWISFSIPYFQYLNTVLMMILDYYCDCFMDFYVSLVWKIMLKCERLYRRNVTTLKTTDVVWKPLNFQV